MVSKYNELNWRFFPNLTSIYQCTYARRSMLIEATTPKVKLITDFNKDFRIFITLIVATTNFGERRYVTL